MQHNHIKNRIVIQACCNGKRLYVELLKHMNEYFFYVLLLIMSTNSPLRFFSETVFSISEAVPR